MRYWFDDRTIHVSTYSFERQRIFEPQDKISANPHDIGFIDGSAAYTYQFHTGNVGDGDYGYLQGEVETISGMLVATIAYDDDSEKDWAISTFRSAKPPPQANRD